MTETADDWIESHRGEIYTAVREALGKLDGSAMSALSLLTGFSAEEIAELGGLTPMTETRRTADE
jgi:hypothetical protein